LESSVKKYFSSFSGAGEVYKYFYGAREVYKYFSGTGEAGEVFIYTRWNPSIRRSA